MYMSREHGDETAWYLPSPDHVGVVPEGVVVYSHLCTFDALMHTEYDALGVTEIFTPSGLLQYPGKSAADIVTYMWESGQSQGHASYPEQRGTRTSEYMYIGVFGK
jgi:hypothetical protein